MVYDYISIPGGSASGLTPEEKKKLQEVRGLLRGVGLANIAAASSFFHVLGLFRKFRAEEMARNIENIARTGRRIKAAKSLSETLLRQSFTHKDDPTRNRLLLATYSWLYGFRPSLIRPEEITALKKLSDAEYGGVAPWFLRGTMRPYFRGVMERVAHQPGLRRAMVTLAALKRSSAAMFVVRPLLSRLGLYGGAAYLSRLALHAAESGVEQQKTLAGEVRDALLHLERTGKTRGELGRVMTTFLPDRQWWAVPPLSFAEQTAPARWWIRQAGGLPPDPSKPQRAWWAAGAWAWWFLGKGWEGLGEFIRGKFGESEMARAKDYVRRQQQTAAAIEAHERGMTIRVPGALAAAAWQQERLQQLDRARWDDVVRW